MKESLITLQNIYNQGERDVKTLAKLTGLHVATIYRNVKKIEHGGSLEQKKGAGPPWKLNSDDRRRLCKLAHNRSTSSARSLQIEMVRRGSHAVIPRTIRNYLNRSGYYSLSPKITSLLKPHHKDNRVSWCQRHMRTHWGRWIFSDESRFDLFRVQVKRWAKERPRVGRPKFCPGIMVWGAIGLRGKSDLIVVKGTINSLKYQDILSAALPSIQRLCPRGFVFQQDGASCHTSRSTRKYFEDNK